MASIRVLSRRVRLLSSRPSTSRLIPSSIRTYHSIYHPQPAPFPPLQTKILSAALTHVPQQGFTPQTLILGARSAGYLDVTTQLFPRGVYDLIDYHLVTQRLALKDRVQFPEDGAKIGTTDKIRALCWSRLQANVEAGVIQHWQEALGQMSLLENIPSSLKELGNLADEIWYLSGDQAVDFSWYTKRGSLSAVYAATETFMTTDKSHEFEETRNFLDRRLADARIIGGAAGGATEFAGFWARNGLGLARSLGIRV